MEQEQSLSDWLQTYNGAIEDRSWLKGSGLEDPGAFGIVHQQGPVGGEDAGSGDNRFKESTHQALKKIEGYKVKQIGTTSDRTFYQVLSPDGKKKQVAIKNDKENALQSFMYAGGPLLMAAPALGAAIGTGLGVSAAAGTALANVGITTALGNKPNARSLLASAVPMITGVIPGLSSLAGTATGAAVNSGISGAIRSKGDITQTLLSALSGGAGGNRLAQFGIRLAQMQAQARNRTQKP